eukprot:TRINITY_DN6194_c0_g1_i7.p1 TRINITY_DN6194_c0_g1~~TRINITY_DN6194_c0_g1_i7.p1  ORF type:complete len:556 (-),score=122.28 TRINITY_DN6194_c0_g1_i7:11-1678(-)
MNKAQIDVPNYRDLWVKVLALVMVNVNWTFPMISSIDIMSVILSVFLNIFNLSPFVVSYLESTENRVDKLKLGKEIILKTSEYRRQELYLQISLFTRSISNLWLEIKSESERTFVLRSIENHSMVLHDHWGYFLNYQQNNSESDTFSPMDEPWQAAIFPTFCDFYLSLIILLNVTLTQITRIQALIWLSIFSHLEFCSVKIEGNDMTAMTTAVGCILDVLSKDGPGYVLNLISSIPILSDPKNLSDSVLNTNEDKQLHSRISFLLGLFQIILQKHSDAQTEHQIPLDIFEDQILPLCFVLLSHPNSTLNYRTHAVFHKIFNMNHPIREQIIPYYIKLSLKNYPKLTPVDSLATSFALMVSKLPSSSPLVLYALDCVKRRVEEITIGEFEADDGVDVDGSVDGMSGLGLHPYSDLEVGKKPNKGEGEGEGEDEDEGPGKGEGEDASGTLYSRSGLNSSSRGKKKRKIHKERAKRGAYLTVILFEMLSYVHPSRLTYLFEMIEDMVTKCSRKMKMVLCHLLYSIISSNYDYTRKEISIKWYLELCHKTGVNELIAKV